MDNSGFPTKTIDDLPVELMHEIFSYLGHYTMKIVALVSKGWNQIVSSSPDFNKRIILKLVKCFVNVEFSRKYRNIILWDCYFIHHTDQEILVMLQKVAELASDVKTLKIVSTNRNDYGVENGKTFLNVLRYFTSIEELEIMLMYIDPSQGKVSRGNVIIDRMPTLRKLEVFHYSWILKHIECPNLQSLQIDQRGDKHDIDQEEIVEFLNKQTQLKTLDLKGVNFITNQELTPKFHLKHIIITSYSSFSKNQNWMRLLGSAAPGSKISIAEVDEQNFLSSFLTMLNDFENINCLEFFTKRATKPETLHDTFLEDSESPLYGKIDHIKSLIMRAGIGLQNYFEIQMWYNWFEELKGNDRIYSCNPEPLRNHYKISPRMMRKFNKSRGQKVKKHLPFNHRKIKLNFFGYAYDIEPFPMLPSIETIDVDVCFCDYAYRKYKIRQPSCFMSASIGVKHRFGYNLWRNGNRKNCYCKLV